MYDRYGRNIDYLRISITDKCNLRCKYCMPGDIESLPMSEILTYEEIGFMGAFLIIGLFIAFFMRGIHIAMNSKDRFGMLIAVGITTQIGIQAVLNLAVVSNLVPNTGISLPFFSYGGTALIMQLAEMGIMLNISQQRYYPDEKVTALRKNRTRHSANKAEPKGA